MLKIIVEMHPFGDENEKYEIESFTIHNDGTGSSEYGNYIATFLGGDTMIPIKGHNRRRGALYLIKEALRKYFMEGPEYERK